MVLIPLQIKHRDYFSMQVQAKSLNQKQKIINLCYEEWAIEMLRKSTKDDYTIESLITEKLEKLKQDILSSKGNVSSIDYTRISKVAEDCGKRAIAIHLLEYEKSVIKKTPFLL